MEYIYIYIYIFVYIYIYIYNPSVMNTIDVNDVQTLNFSRNSYFSIRLPTLLIVDNVKVFRFYQKKGKKNKRKEHFIL